MPKPKILVTGATGKTGAPTALNLLKVGFPVRALVHRGDARSERLRSAGAEIVIGSLENIRDLETAMRGVARAYFCPPLEPGTLRRAAIFAAASRQAKLEAVVHLSQWLADAIHPALHAREKWLSNQVMDGLPGTATVRIQPGWFADNYFAVLGQVAQFGLLGLPLGEGLNAPPSNEDIAAVIAACLAEPDRHAGKAYRPTGPKLMAPTDIAAVMAQALNRRVRYQNVPIKMFLKAAGSLGLTPFVVTQLYWFLQDYQRGAFGLGAPTSAVQEVTGRPPEDFLTIAKRYVEQTPAAKRGFAGVIRETAGIISALTARPVDIALAERQLGIQQSSGFQLASNSDDWLAGHR
jgi:NAD(P)H dehydrogenase (quinone)